MNLPEKLSNVLIKHLKGLVHSLKEHVFSLTCTHVGLSLRFVPLSREANGTLFVVIQILQEHIKPDSSTSKTEKKYNHDYNYKNSNKNNKR